MTNKLSLKQHREEIANSKGIIPEEERKRLYASVRSHLSRCGAKDLKNKENEIKLFVDLLLGTQNGKPFFWIDEPLPFCWNNPRDWGKYSYIRLQWAHIDPVYWNIQSDHNVHDKYEMLCLQSARGNNQIQSSLSIEDVKKLFKGSKTYYRIIEVEKQRNKLFCSVKWRELIERLTKSYQEEARARDMGERTNHKQRPE